MSRLIHDIIQFFFSHDVTDETKERVQRRLALVEDDADGAFRQVWDGLDDATANEKSVEKAWQRTSRAIFGQENRTAKWHVWLRTAAIWAIPIALMCASYYFYKAYNQNVQISETPNFVHKFTAYGEREMVTLPDSSKVWLNGGSTLIYPARFVSKERSVCLSGEAFFEVVEDAAHPFIVEINHVRLKVLGTTFNVCAYPNQLETTTTLETGKIQIEVEGKEQCYILAPNDQLVYNSQTGRVNISQVRASDYSTWRTGALYFDNAKFSHVIAQLERAYNVKIHVRSDRFNEQTIRAHFTFNESVDEIMAIVKMLIPSLHYEIKGNDIYIE